MVTDELNWPIRLWPALAYSMLSEGQITTASQFDSGKNLRNFTLRMVATFTRGGNSEVIHSTFFIMAVLRIEKRNLVTSESTNVKSALESFGHSQENANLVGWRRRLRTNPHKNRRRYGEYPDKNPFHPSSPPNGNDCPLCSNPG